MKLNIMTWNTGITESLEDTNKCEQILEYIKGFLEKENAIVFLQQIVYKDCDNNWNEHPVFSTLCEKFKEDYEIKCNQDNKYIVMMTVAIAKKGKLQSLDREFYPMNSPLNRAIAVEFNGVSFLGIHASNGDKNKHYLNSLHGKADIILGDFNAGNYIGSENRNTFNQILKEHICICNMPTKVTTSGKRTCIDHVFVRDDMVTKCSNLIVKEEIKLSDHFPITFEFNE